MADRPMIFSGPMVRALLDGSNPTCDEVERALKVIRGNLKPTVVLTKGEVDALAAENAALREKLEAAEGERRHGEMDYLNLTERYDRLQTALTEARGQAAEAEARGWNAAFNEAALHWQSDAARETILALRRTPKEAP